MKYEQITIFIVHIFIMKLGFLNIILIIFEFTQIIGDHFQV